MKKFNIGALSSALAVLLLVGCNGQGYQSRGEPVTEVTTTTTTLPPGETAPHYRATHPNVVTTGQAYVGANGGVGYSPE